MQNTPGIGQSIAIAVGQKCSPTWGGGKIARIEIDPTLGAAVFYKDVPYDDHKAMRFASVCVPLSRLKCWTMVEEPAAKQTEEQFVEAQRDPPPAKPVQGNQQRR